MTSATVPLLGPGVKGKSPVLTAQRRLNYYVEEYQADVDRAPFNLLQRPGLTRLQSSQYVIQVAVAPGGPLRAISEVVTFKPSGGVAQDVVVLFNAQYAGIYAPNQVDFINTGTSGSVIGTNFGKIRTASNGPQLLVTDGGPGASLDLTNVGMPVTLGSAITNFPIGAKYCCFIAGRHVVDDPSGSGRFRWSGTYNTQSWDPLDFATAESCPDPLSMLLENGGELWLFGTLTIEFWAPSADTRVFARIGSAGIDYGTTAPWSVQKVNGGVCFLGKPRAGGERQVYFILDHAAQAITSPDVIANINASSNADAATGTAFTIAGHTFYVLNLPETSWAFDFATQTWDEWQTVGGRWCVEHVMSAFGHLLCSDYRDSRLYFLDVTSFLDDTDIITRESITKHLLSGGNWITVDELVVDYEVGSQSIPAVWPRALDFSFNDPAKRAYYGVGALAVTATSSAARVPNSAAFTLECWVKITGDPGSAMMILKKITASGTCPRLYYQSGFFLFDNNAAGSVQIAAAQPGWHFISCVYDGAIASIYRDAGSPATVAAADFGGLTAGTGFEIGSQGGAFLLYGVVSEVRVWNFAKTAAQVQAGMNTPCTGREPGLVGLLGSMTPTGSTNTMVQDDSPSQGLAGLIPANVLWAFVVNYTNAAGQVAYTFSPPAVRDNIPLAAARAPQVMASWSKDGGRTFGTEVWQDIGFVGQYRKRTIWRALGRCRDFVIKFRVTDACKIVMSAMTARVR